MIIEVQELSASEFQVTVTEGGSLTRHTVTVPDGLYQKLTQSKIDKAACVRAAFAFLLDREPKESIMSRFDLPVISRYFPEFERKFADYV